MYESRYDIEVESALKGYHLSYAMVMRDSPNGQYKMNLSFCRQNEESETGYIVGYLLRLSKEEGKNWVLEKNPTFFQQVRTEDIHNVVTKTGVLMKFWVECDWIDDENLMINGIPVNIHKGYDYRRDS